VADPTAPGAAAAAVSLTAPLERWDIIY
jgi:hypothetical protein